MPRSIANIGDYAFGCCEKLLNFYARSEKPAAITETAFSNTNLSNCTLHVPAGTKTAYSTADGWKYFGNIVETANTSIGNAAATPEEEIIFDLKGNRMTFPQKGICIINGKKVLY